MKKISGKIRTKPDGGGLVKKPVDGSTGYWTPSDQDEHPITPVHVTFYAGMWYAPMAYASLFK